METYYAKVTPSDRMWIITVDGVKFGMTQARKLKDVEPMARDLIASLMDVPADSFELVITWPEGIAGYAAMVDEARRALLQAQGRSEQATRMAALGLVRQRGLSVRDAAAVLHLSPARIGQLTNGE